MHNESSPRHHDRERFPISLITNPSLALQPDGGYSFSPPLHTPSLTANTRSVGLDEIGDFLAIVLMGTVPSVEIDSSPRRSRIRKARLSALSGLNEMRALKSQAVAEEAQVLAVWEME